MHTLPYMRPLKMYHVLYMWSLARLAVFSLFMRHVRHVRHVGHVAYSVAFRWHSGDE